MPERSPWDKRSLACKVTWITLRLLHQHKRVFNSAGRLRVKQLSFWKSSTAARNAGRAMLVPQIDLLFREMYGSVYESGVTRAKALRALDSVLQQGDATLADVAAVADVQYEFLGEART